MPPHIMTAIIEELDWNSRRSLRNTCRTLRSAVNSIPMKFGYLQLHFSSKFAALGFGEQSHQIDHRIGYHRLRSDKVYVRKGEFETLKTHRDCWKMAICDAAKTVLKTPKISVASLLISFSKPSKRTKSVWNFHKIQEKKDEIKFGSKKNKTMKTIKNRFFDPKRRLKVQELTIGCQGNERSLMEILPFFEPGTLKSITFSNEDGEEEEEEEEEEDNSFRVKTVKMSRIIETDQWKMLKKFHVADGFQVQISIEQLLHLDDFEATLAEISVQEVKKLIRHALITPSFNDFKLQCHNFDAIEVDEMLGSSAFICRNERNYRVYKRIGSENGALLVLIDHDFIGVFGDYNVWEEDRKLDKFEAFDTPPL
ncbi:unnamed protein product [Caenorhabditis sp. 36 PRJEB53466]|nr:unnamed protein product [Caenorhabditis sp. 36 PRJEB53466]